VLPSESENFGNVITEALSQSTPVIASIGTPWQILKDKKIGWWTSNTPENLAKVLDELYSLTEKEYNDYSLGARKYVEDCLDIKTSKYNNWSDIYSNLVTPSCKS
jgi:glycosyltransferase involved in cell wall biosynthesis